MCILGASNTLVAEEILEITLTELDTLKMNNSNILSRKRNKLIEYLKAKIGDYEEDASLKITVKSDEGCMDKLCIH